MIKSRVGLLFTFGMVLCTATAQVFMKLAGQESLKSSGFAGQFITNPWLWMSLLFSGCGLLFWVIALRTIPLSKAYPWTALIYVLTPIASMVLFNDLLMTKQLIGLSCIVLGVLLTNWGVKNDHP
jgi:multidrug transporter EmrE-like cation transporter